MTIYTTATQNTYYKSRPTNEPVDYESYWKESVDPDGVTRDRISDHERTEYLKSIKKELEFVRGLRPVPRTLLDVGCGAGWFLSELGRAGSSIQLHGIDVSRHVVDFARRTTCATIHRGDLGDLGKSGYLNDTGYWTSFWDVIFCHHVIEHIEDPLSLLVEMRRILKPGGHLIIATPDFESPCAKRFGDNYRMLHDKTHVSLFSNESMHRFLTDNGFEIDVVDYPFPEKYATAETMDRWNDTTKVSPPWPGSWMTFYCRRLGDRNGTKVNATMLSESGAC